MKRLFLPHLTLLLTALFLGACENPQPKPPPPRNRAPGFNPPPRSTSQDDDSPGRSTTTDSTHSSSGDTASGSGSGSSHVDAQTDTTATPPAKTGSYEYGKPVPDRPGFVTSPYAPEKGYVDVRNFPPGTEVRDPYSGKIFLVP